MMSMLIDGLHTKQLLQYIYGKRLINFFRSSGLLLSEKQGVGSLILPLATNNYLGYSDKIITNNRNTEQNTEHHSEKAYKH